MPATHTSTNALAKRRALLARAGRLHWGHWLVVALSLAVTLGAWAFSSRQVEQRTEARFAREAEQVQRLITERMEKYEDALWSGVAAMHAHGGAMSYHEWKRFANSLQIDTKYPGINGIGVIHEVTPEALDDYLLEQRQHRPEYKIHPPHREQEYLPITYIEPVETNAPAVGLDMAHEQNRYAAARRARATGTAQITGPIVLVQDSAKTPGFLFYAPYYTGSTRGRVDHADASSEFLGLVYAPFVVNKLMLGTLHKENRHVGVSITDAGQVIYDEHHATEPDFDANPLFQTTLTTDLYGRTWSLDIRSAHSFRDSVHHSLPLMILLGGILIDILLVTLFVALTRSNRRAISFADAVAAELEESVAEVRRLQAAATASSDGFWSWDLGDNVWYSDRFKKLLGYEPDEFPHSLEAFKSRLHPDNLAPVEAALTSHLEGQVPYDVTYRLMTKAQGYRWFRARGQLERDDAGTPINMSGSIIDMTDLIEAQSRLEAHTIELEQSNRELDDFAYIASHDLREPLRGIAHYSSFLLEDYAEKLDDEGKNMLETLPRLASRLEDLVDSLLYYSRVGREPLETEEVPLDGVVDETLELLQHSLDERGVTVHRSSALPTKLCDRTRIGNIFANLIGNAAKYNDKDEPTITVGMIEDPQTAEPVFYVRDNGIGIRDKDRERIFAIFRRLHGRNEFGGGVGAGLTIVRKMIEQHSGAIWVRSVPGEGTTFYFSLGPVNGEPCLPDDAAAEEARLAGSDDSTKRLTEQG